MKQKQTRKQISSKVTAMFDDTIKKSIITVVTEQEHGMTMPISQLPDCEHKRFLSNVVTDPKTAHICIVAEWSKEVSDRWVAYIGYPDSKDLKYIKDEGLASTLEWDCVHIRSISQVKMLGVVLDSKTAHKLFPDWDINKYLSPTLS